MDQRRKRTLQRTALAVGGGIAAAATALFLWRRWQQIHRAKIAAGALVIREGLLASRVSREYRKLRLAVVVMQSLWRRRQARLFTAAIRLAVLMGASLKRVRARQRMRRLLFVCTSIRTRIHKRANSRIDLGGWQLRNDGVREALSGRDLANMHTLIMSRNSLTSLPEEVRSMKRLAKLSADWNLLSTLPSWLGQVGSLRVLTLSENKHLLGDFPESLGLLTNLSTLDLSATGLKRCPLWIARISGLCELNLGRNQGLGETLHDPAFEKLGSLRSLNLESTELKEWPKWVGKLSKLRGLSISGNWDLQVDACCDGWLSNLEELDAVAMGLRALPKCVCKMQLLQKLNLRRNKDLGEGLEDGQLEVHFPGLTRLDLSGIGLKRCPIWLDSLSDLEELYLGGNWELANAVCSANLARLRKLKVLNLAGSYVTQCPPWIGDLHSLEELDFSGNYGLGKGMDVAHAGLLGRLRTLSLSGIDLRGFPDWVGELGVTDLNLSNNQGLCDVIGEAHIGSLVDLISLDISNTSLTDIPSWILSLSQLKELKMAQNQGLCWEGFHFKMASGLRLLDISATGLKKLPDGLEKLEQLCSLCLGNNEQLGMCLHGACIGQLTNITFLDIHQIGLETCPSWIGDLVQLRDVNFSGNTELKKLPFSLGECKLLRNLNLGGCINLQIPPTQVCKQGAGSCLRYLRDLNKGHVQCRLLKMMLLGDPKAGKSSLLDTMQSGRPCLRREDDRTVSVVVKTHKLNQGSRLVVNSYDAGGHEVYLATHRFFISPGALYLCVVDISEEGCREKVLKWFEAVQSQTPGAAVVLIATHVDMIEPEGLCVLNSDSEREIGSEQIRALNARVFKGLSEIQEDVLSWEEQVFKELRSALQEIEDDMMVNMGVEWRSLRKRRDEMLASAIHLGGINRILDPAVQSSAAFFQQDSIADGAEKFHRTLEQVKAVGSVKSRLQISELNTAMLRIETESRVDGNEPAGDFCHVIKLRELLVARPRLILCAGVSLNASAWGVDALLDALEGLGQDKSIFPLVNSMIPLSYLMLQNCFWQGGGGLSHEFKDVGQTELSSRRMCPQGHALAQFVTPDCYGCDMCSNRISPGVVMFGCRQCNWDLCLPCVQANKSQATADKDSSAETVKLEWQHVVQKYTEEHCSPELQNLCCRPYVESSELIAEAVRCGMDREEVRGALEFLKTIGAVLYYGEEASDEKLRGYVFTRPQWIIDAIKFVIHERKDEDLDEEMRSLHKKLDLQGKMQLNSLHNRGRLCERLLRFWLWDKISNEDQDVLVSLMQAFRLLHECKGNGKSGVKWCHVCAREGHSSYVVPAMLQRGSLDARYTTPCVWSPEMSWGCKSVMRCEYQCSRLENSFLSDLQVDWCSSGGMQLQGRIVSIHVLGQSADGIVMKYEESDTIDETVVVTLHRTEMAVGIFQVCVLRVVGWVEMVESGEDKAATEWPLFNHVMQCIDTAELRQPGLRLIASVPCGDDLEERKLLRELRTGGRRVTLRTGKSIECSKLLPTRKILQRTDPPAVSAPREPPSLLAAQIQPPVWPFVCLHRVLDSPVTPVSSKSPLTGSSSRDSQRSGRDTRGAAEQLHDEEPLHLPGYTTLEKLGSGMQGSVWLAQTTGAEKVVIKFTRPGPEALREYENLSRVPKGHPNIVSMRDVVKEGVDFVGIVMDYVQGESLLQRLRRERSRAARRTGDLTGDVVSACSVLCDVLNGLAALHSIRPYPVVHRDIKPANIMLRLSDGSAVVVDLGLSKRFGMDEQSITDSDPKGTLAYASPEVAMGGGEKEVDQRADVWSCGVMLYEIVAGVRPFVADNSLRLIENIKMMEVPQLVGKLVGKHALGKLLSKALSKDRRERFADASHMRRVVKMIRDRPNVVPGELLLQFSDCVQPLSQQTIQPLIEQQQGMPGKLVQAGEKWKVIFFSCRCGTTIDPERECQEFKDLLRKFRDVFTFDSYPRPEIKHFTDELRDTRTCDEKKRLILHFSGHASGSTGGLYWFSKAGKKVKENQVTGEHLANLIEIHNQYGLMERMDCFFLNACSTLAAGLELCKRGVRVVICWQTKIKQSIARDFAFRFYEILSESPGDYDSAFATVCNEMAQQLSFVRPCILHCGEPGKVGSVQVWCSNENMMGMMVSLSDQQLFLQVGLASQLSGSSSEEFDELLPGEDVYDEDDDCEEEDPEKNWNAPKNPLDFAAHAGLAEQSLLSSLGFDISMVVKNQSGMVTAASWKAIGVGSFGALWGSSGKIVKKAEEILTSSKKESNSAPGLCKICTQLKCKSRCWPLADQSKMKKVEGAISALQMCMYFRQMDVMVYRMNNGKKWSGKQWGTCKQTVLKMARKEVMQSFHDDVRDRNTLKEGGTLDAARQQELLGACQSHLFQLDCRSETCDGLSKLVHKIRLHKVLEALSS